MAVEQALAEFAEREGADAFTLQSSKLLKVSLAGATIQAALGSMVAYQGEVTFEHAGSGGMSKFLKSKLSGEGTPLRKVAGTGEVFLASQAQDIHVFRLDGDSITVNGANLLAFESGIDWDIKASQGMGGMLAGGRFNVELSGSGQVAIVSDGPPMLLRLDGSTPTFADPQAAITWSSGVRTDVRADVNLKTLIGRASGETVQVAFSGTGWVLIQPSEGRVTATGDAGSRGGGGEGLLGGLLKG
jgi:uncharacterized protein (AIM24 family)